MASSANAAGVSAVNPQFVPTLLGKKVLAPKDSIFRNAPRLIPPEQVVAKWNQNKYRNITLPTANIVAAAFTNGNYPIELTIPKQVGDRLKSLVLHLQISNASATSVLVPMPYWFERIEFIDSQNTIIQTLHHDTMFFSLAFIRDKDELKAVKNAANIMEDGWNSKYDTIAVGATRDYYLPLVGNWMEILGLNFRLLQNDIRIRFTTFGGGGIISPSSGQGTVSLTTTFELNLKEEYNDPDDLKAEEWLSKQYGFQSYYLDWQRVTSASTSLTGGTETRIPITNIRGWVPFMFFVVRSANNSNVSDAMSYYESLGEAAKIELLDTVGQNLFGAGTNVTGGYLKKFLFPEQMKSDLSRHRNVYMISWCDDPQRAMRGVLNNAMWFDSNTKNLLVNPVTATQCVQSVDLLSNTNNAGYYNLSYKGEVTPDLKYDTTAANMKIAFEKLSTVRRDGLQATFSGTAVTDYTVTFANRDGNVPDLIKHISTSTSASGTQDFASTSVTTEGKAGISNGSSYIFDMYFPRMRCVTQKGKAGVFSVTDVTAGMSDTLPLDPADN